MLPEGVLSDTTSLLAGGVAGLALLWWLSTRRPRGLPPGPGPALPILGHLHLMEQDPRPKFREWRRRYGDVFSLYLGGELMVVLNGFAVIKEALVKMADVFSERPHNFIIDRISEGKGVVGSSGAEWREQRRLGLQILREMGMGKNVLAEKIQEEVAHYVRAIEQHQGEPVDLHTLTQASISNNICSIVYGQRFEYDNPEFIAYLGYMDYNFKLIAGTALLNFFPILEHVPGDPCKMKKILSYVKKVEDFIGEQIKAHATVSEDEGEGSADFLGAYIREIRKMEKNGVTDTTVNVESLRKIAGDLFVAGTETTSTALRWAMLLFLHHPDVQDKCFKEVSDVIGNRTPSMRDRPEMTYLEATTWEVLRYGSIAPLAVPHGVPCDVTFHGYVIPKGATILPNIDSVLHDPEVWGDPESFRPERFIGVDGKLNKAEELIPFSTGRRVCLGESLARTELFLYLSNLVQHFCLLPEEPEKLPSLKGIYGLSHQPQPFKVRAVPRRTTVGGKKKMNKT